MNDRVQISEISKISEILTGARTSPRPRAPSERCFYTNPWQLACRKLTKIVIDIRIRRGTMKSDFAWRLCNTADVIHFRQRGSCEDWQRAC